jgi:dihydrofolate synthase/folylpolyglutamate synthase
MARRTLAEWLDYQSRIHPLSMDFTLDRIRTVLDRLGLLTPKPPVITVGGTNGKGSVTALLEAIVSAGGGRVGVYTSPHLERYQERIRVAGAEVEEAWLLEAFEAIEAVRGEITLTYFEYATAAALWCFARDPLDLIILEVGLGGRLDAVNVIDADASIVVSVSLDHCEYLGDTVEAIGFEKAGIFRAGRPAFFGSTAMPASIEAHATHLGARLERFGAEFTAVLADSGFEFRRGSTHLQGLPPPALQGAAQVGNAATVLAALESLELLPAPTAIAAGLRGVRLTGRFEVRPGPVSWVFDVAHNPGAAAVLVDTLRAEPRAGRTILVAGMLRDKDAVAVGRELARLVAPGDLVCAVTLAGERGRPADELAALWGPLLAGEISLATDVEAGCAFAAHHAVPGDRVVVFGSFHVVGPALHWHRLYCSTQ